MSERKRTAAYTLPPATVKAVKAEAVKQRRSASAVVGVVVEGWMNNKKEKKQC